MGILDIAPPTEAELTTEPDDGSRVINPLDITAGTPAGTTPPMADFAGETPVLPSRITGKGLPEDYVGHGFMSNPYLGSLVRGANEYILALPQAGINAVAFGLESAGIVEEGTVDRNFLRRLFNSSDYESQKIVIPYLLNYGEGEFAGQAEQEGKISAMMRSAGQAAIAALPFVGIQMRAAAVPATEVTRLGSKIPFLGIDVLGKGATTPSTTSTAAGVADTLMAGFRASPATAVAAETGLGAASGALAEAETQFLGTNTGLGALAPLAPVGIYYGGKTAVTKGPIGRLFKWGKNTIGGGIDDAAVLTGKRDPAEGTAGAAALAKLGDDVKEAAATPEAQANLQRAAEIEATLGGFADEPITFSPAEATLDAPLLATQTKLEGAGSPEFTRKNLARKNNVLSAAQKFIDNELIGSPVDDAPLYVYDLAKQRYYQTVGRIDADADELASNWQMVTNAETGVFPKLGSRAEAGASIRNTIVAARDAAKEDAAKLAKKLRINDADPVGDANATQAAQAAVRDALTSKAGEKALSYQGLPSLVRNFIEKDFEKGRMSFQDWKLFRDQVGGAIGAAMAKGDKAAVRPLAILSEQLDNMAVSFGKTNEKFEQFRLVYDKNVVAPFERSGVIKVTGKAAGSTKEDVQYYLADEEVAKSFLENTNTARQFMNLFADKPADLRHMKNVVLDQLRVKAYSPNKGIFEPDKVNSYLNQNREVLEILGLTDDLLNTETMLRDMVARNAELTARRRAVNGNLLMGTIARAEKNQKPEQLFADALKSPAKMRELREIAEAGSDSLAPEEAAAAFRSAVTERMFKETPSAMENPTAFKQWLSDNERILDAAFDKSHVDNMYLIADAAERVLITGLRRGTGVKDEDIIERFTNALGSTPANVSNRILSVGEGRLGQKAAVGYFLSRAIRQRSTVRSDALFREAMFNPEIAKLLVAEGGESVPPLGISQPNLRRINTYLFNVGIDYGEGTSGEGATQEFRFDVNVPTEPITEPPVPEPKPTLPQRLQKEMDPSYFQNMYPTVPTVPTPTPKPPRPPAGNQASVGIETLFPNDPTSIAIAKRRAAGQAPTGIV